MSLLVLMQNFFTLSQRSKVFLQILVVAVSYFFAGMLGLQIASVGSHISLFWAPTGIAIAGLLRFGTITGIGIWIASFFVNYLIGSSILLSLVIASGNTLGPLAAVYFLKKLRFRISLERRKDLLLYVLIVTIAMAINASVGSISLFLFGVLDYSKLSEAWLCWWLGDAVGAMVAGLPFVSYSGKRVLRELKGWKGVENLFVLALLFLCGALLFGIPPFVIISIPVFLFASFILVSWLGLRSGVTISSFATLLTSVIGAWATANGSGPFVQAGIYSGLGLLWGYMTAMTILSVLISALVSELSSSDLLLTDLSDQVPGVIYQFKMDLEGNRSFPFLSQGFEGIFGFSPESVQEDAGLFFEVVYPEDLKIIEDTMKSSSFMQTPFRIEFRISSTKRELVWLEAQGIPEMLKDGSILWNGHISDISVRKQAEKTLRENEEKLYGLFSLSPIGIALTDMNGKYHEFNDAFRLITGYTEDELNQLDYWKLTPEKYKDMELLQLKSLSETRKYGPYEKEYLRKDGILVPIRLRGVLLTGKDGQEYIWSLVEDITNQKDQQHRLEIMAHYDALTQLPNRILLAERLQEAMLHSISSEKLLAICYLDLDEFKPINDQFGHEAGDRFLIEVARRLRQLLREADTVARLGGDEFVLLFTNLQSIEEGEELLSNLLREISFKYSLKENLLEASVTASIGVTFFPNDRVDADGLIRHADQAMYFAKQAGKNRFHIFDSELDRHFRVKYEAIARIRIALERNEFQLYYQPKVNMKTGKVVGAEALIRWIHPERGIVPPLEFLPVIENSEFSISLGEWVINEGLRQMNEWAANGIMLPVSVNISAKHLQHKSFLGRLSEFLKKYPNVSANQLELEILETSALEDIARVCSLIEECKQMGVLFALDDFGTGYSSLTYLKRLSTEVLKIDQSFVRDMLTDKEDKAIVQGVIGLAKAFHRKVIAEGVETIEQGILLLEMGCDLAQGYGIARPMPAKDFALWVNAYKPEPKWNISPINI
ncbi:MAG: EAL domain-containing protein [Leptospiraceae bacterium]|nr:EAL domain-containing protein [Leptospiraceae bacterium]